MSLLDWTASRPGLSADRSRPFIALARAAIVWERVWPALWPASGIIGLYAAAALLGIFSVFPGFLRTLIYFAVLVASGYSLWRGFLDFRFARWEEAARRVERDSTLKHRPLTESGDRLAAGAGDPWAEELWRVHLKRLLEGIARLKVALPSPGLPSRDPYALRYAVLLLVAAGFVVSGSDWSRRLAFAFSPTSGQGAVAAELDAWISPPPYTGEAPIYLRRGEARTIAVPIGSQLSLRVHSASGLPSLSLDPRPKGQAPEFAGASEEFGTSARLREDSDISVREAGRLLGSWHVKVIPDNPPMIAFAEPPSRTERGAVKFAFTAGDDYGVVSARALIRPVRASKQSHAILSVDLPLSSPSAKTLSQTVYSDLTGEPFAGLEVQVTLEARDGAGQRGVSKPVRFWLPARVFTNPLARALIEQRQNLALAEPHAKERVARTLDALTIAPEHFYANQASAYLAIRTAYWSLLAANHPDEIARVQDLLWQTAVGIEDGGVLSAAEQLRQIQQLLSQALAQGAPQGEIDALLNRYMQAMQRYLQALAQNSSKSDGQLPPNAKVLSTEDIQKMIQAIQQLAQTGARDQAAQMLALLQGLLENLHMSSGGGGGQAGPAGKALSDAIQGLSDLTGKQREVLDTSYRQNQGAGDPADGGGKGLAQQQGKLRQDLDKIGKALGALNLPQPRSLGEAGKQMDNAQQQLGSGVFDGAGESQKNALDALRQGSNELAQELMKRSGQGTSEQDGAQDPLGRRAGSSGAGDGNVKLPDQSDLARARAILEELRKRASEQGRPKEELDYIDRLLKEF